MCCWLDPTVPSTVLELPSPSPPYLSHVYYPICIPSPASFTTYQHGSSSQATFQQTTTLPLEGRREHPLTTLPLLPPPALQGLLLHTQLLYAGHLCHTTIWPKFTTFLPSPPGTDTCFFLPELVLLLFYAHCLPTTYTSYYTLVLVVSPPYPIFPTTMILCSSHTLPSLLD